MSETMPFVSVIVPVRNDTERLLLCLSALERQTYPADCYEVIVVDNGSDEPIAPHISSFEQVQGAVETEPGPSAARNKGIELARGHIIAFTDADCIPETDWLAQGVAHLRQTPNCGLLAGRVEIFYEDPKHPTPAEIYERYTAFPQKRFIENDHYGVTANLFTYRAVIDHVGMFDTNMPIYSEDVEWGQRVFAAGYTQVYVASVSIRHPARRSASDMFKRTHAVMTSVHLLNQRRSYKPGQLVRDFVREFVPPLTLMSSIWHDSEINDTGLKVRAMLLAVALKWQRGWLRLKLHLQGAKNA